MLTGLDRVTAIQWRPGRVDDDNTEQERLGIDLRWREEA